jgi:hypothetical protein
VQDIGFKLELKKLAGQRLSRGVKNSICTQNWMGIKMKSGMRHLPSYHYA